MTYQHASPVRDRLSRLARIANDEFADVLSDPPRVIGVRLRLYLVDGSFLDVRYPTDDEYSFHWQVEDKVYRNNNAPHHPGPTFPRHVHMFTLHLLSDPGRGVVSDVRPNSRKYTRQLASGKRGCAK